MTILALDLDQGQKEKLREIWDKDLDRFVLYGTSFPPCPQGRKCECPNVKKAMGLEFHACDPDPATGCIVQVSVFSQGV
ncbi:MAG: hypothetical protein WC444_00700 [Candidatus Paceibacterota bacterium]